MGEKSCNVDCVDLISVEWFENDILRLSYLAFGTGRHYLNFEHEILWYKIRV